MEKVFHVIYVYYTSTVFRNMVYGAERLLSGLEHIALRRAEFSSQYIQWMAHNSL